MAGPIPHGSEGGDELGRVEAAACDVMLDNHRLEAHEIVEAAAAYIKESVLLNAVAIVTRCGGARREGAGSGRGRRGAARHEARLVVRHRIVVLVFLVHLLGLLLRGPLWRLVLDLVVRCGGCRQFTLQHLQPLAELDRAVSHVVIGERIFRKIFGVHLLEQGMRQPLLHHEPQRKPRARACSLLRERIFSALAERSGDGTLRFVTRVHFPAGSELKALRCRPARGAGAPSRAQQVQDDSTLVPA